ncbi:vesicular-fusion protein SEC17 [Tritrichomonas foetus]|uniref:Gamma-soluble NSF attachment protein n=1 Tax=Tritrichomonas foetus TaxID=1144522 RepID=A0A1J4KS27_9EUKA|nr:vesicular-fusion protein SEC17 [Tritrichomonas foetus]|eukprot:OHT12470.1 vesicular-fusion protein SEC17 [Tritrichomonas foetus]
MSSKRGDQLFEDAKKISHQKTLLGKKKNPAKAADKYDQAGNAYKIDRIWKKAGECHMNAAKLYIETKDNAAAVSQFKEAAKCYAKDPDAIELATEAYKSAGNLYLDMGRKPYDAGRCFLDAANMHLEIDRNEDGINLLRLAIDAFGKDEISKSLLAKSYDLLGDTLAEEKQYREAVDCYEKHMKIKIETQLTQRSAYYSFFKMVLTYLQLDDTIGANKKLESFIKLHPAFRNEDEYPFLQKLIKILDQKDIDKFDDEIEEYWKRNPSDPFIQNRFLDMRHLADDGTAYEDKYPRPEEKETVKIKIQMDENGNPIGRSDMPDEPNQKSSKKDSSKSNDTDNDKNQGNSAPKYDDDLDFDDADLPDDWGLL